MRALTQAMFVGLLGAVFFSSILRADDTETLKTLDSRVITDETAAAEAREAVRRDVRARLQIAERRHSAAWYTVQSREDWEALRDVRLAHLQRSLTHDPLPTEPKHVRTTRRLDGEGFRIECLTYESRPGVVVTANLYVPQPTPPEKMPGILIVHSHHAPKTQGELQDMGMTFARQGATVLVIDQLGHGERRTHAFGVEGKYPGSYKPSRQDYYFRYNTATQLSLVGESLMGWMVGDLMCGATLVARRPGVDPKKLILLGAVAGGGDPAAVTAALDKRFAAVVPFNFGGYEPEDVYPLPDDAEQTFNYAGSGSWESTRNLRLSARDGFMPWLVVGSAAPRAVVYAHEFRWDEPRDPVWKRLQTIFSYYQAADRLGSAFGSGTVKGKTVEDSHCTNIGPKHRAQLYPYFEQWFGLPAPKAEYSQRRTSDELRCLSETEPFALHEVVQKMAAERLAASRARRAGMSVQELRSALRTELGALLGTVESATSVQIEAAVPQNVEGITVERVRLDLGEAGGAVPVPLLLLRSAQMPPADVPRVVVMVAQGGKQAVLQQRAKLIAACLQRGVVVVLPDLRGTGETGSPGDGRGRTSGATSRSATEQMLGETMLGRRLRDLRTVLAYLRDRDDLKRAKVSLYGDGLVAANAPDLNAAAPLDAEKLPTAGEPMGAIACLLAALWDDSIAGVCAGGGPTSFDSILDEPYFYVPHDSILPGVLAHADVAELVAAQVGRAVFLQVRDGANRPTAERPTSLARNTAFYKAYLAMIPADAEPRLEEDLRDDAPTPESLALWLTTDRPK